MSYVILKQLWITKEAVYSSRVEYGGGLDCPRRFQKIEDEILTAHFKEGGTEAVFRFLGEEVFKRNILLSSQGCRMCDALKRASDLLAPPLRFSLDAEHAGKFVATVARGYLADPFYCPSSELQMLNALRYDPEAVFMICKTNPAAFIFSDDSIRRNRDHAKRYVKEHCTSAGFSFPSYFQRDKELALLALKRCPPEKISGIYDSLDATLHNDKEIVLLSFTRPETRMVQASRIGPRLLENVIFMCALVEKCPMLDISGCEDLLQYPAFAEAWIKYNHLAIQKIHLLPKELLAQFSIRIAIHKRVATLPGSQKDAIIALLYDDSMYEALVDAPPELPSTS